MGSSKNLFRPSCRGNRNFTLMHTLGGLVVSSDDDMRPYALMEHSPESLDEGEVFCGRLHRTGQNGYSRKSFNIVSAFLDVLGKRAAEVPQNYDKGEVLVDTAMDLETNVTKGLAPQNSLILKRGPVAADAVVKMAQNFRSGTNDIDAMDYADLFLEDEDQTDPDGLNDHFVLVNFRPAITRANWRMDCGVAGYDNTFGLPPFFPTRLRAPKITSIDFGSSKRASRRPTLMPPKTTPAPTSCVIRSPPRFSTRRCRTYSKRKIKDSVSR